MGFLERGSYTSGVASSDRSDDALLSKLESLPAEDLAEVEHFVDLLRERRENGLVWEYMKLSEEAFARIWDNPDDAEYDRL
jgi:hypothetical protein